MNNPRAFPSPPIGNMYGPEWGMTLRDYFAAMAMHAMWADIKAHSDTIRTGCEQMNCSASIYIATQAYQMADIMLMEREKHQP